MRLDGGGGSSSKPKPSLGGGASAGAASVPKLPSWMKDDQPAATSSDNPIRSTLEAGFSPKVQEPNPAWAALAATPKPALPGLADDLGMYTGALTPAAEVAKESEPGLQPKVEDAWSAFYGVPKQAEGLKPRGLDAKPKAMTREDYLDLPAEVRAAVDFNSMLVQARGIDRAARKAGEAPELQRSVNTGAVSVGTMGQTVQAGPMSTSETLPDGYGDVYEAVFGERPKRLVATGMGAESEKLDTPKLAPIAPEVLSVLKQIGYKGEDPEEMREFLNLQNGISKSDIDNYLLDKDEPVIRQPLPGLDFVPKNDREKFVEKIVSLTQDLETKLAEGDKMIADFQTSALVAREGDRLTAGAQVQPIETPFGFGDGRKVGQFTEGGGIDEAFQNTYNYLLGLQDPQEAAEVMGRFDAVLKENGVNPEAFTQYVNTRLDNNERYKQPIGDEDGKIEYRSPDEYRKLLGLGRKEG